MADFVLKDRDTSGRKPSTMLFKQYAQPDIVEPIYDLDEFKRVFVESLDVTEYAPAMQLVGDWAEWQRIKRDWPAFAKMVEAWKDEIEVKLRSISMARIKNMVTESSDQIAINAAKFIATNGWKDKGGAGRPSKREIESQTKELARQAAQTADEEKRIVDLLGSQIDNETLQ